MDLVSNSFVLSFMIITVSDVPLCNPSMNTLPVTNNEPVISAEPENGKPAPVPPPPPFNANDAVVA
jgi:hypothetical protein